MNAREQIQIIFDLLKQHLREKKISYRELANRTVMSEGNVKRIFSVQSCDMERLIQFCDAAEIKFFDLVSAASRVGPYAYEISDEAEEYFCKNFECFIFFREISTSGDVQKAIATSKLPKDKIRAFLKDLLRLNLLELGKTSYQLKSTGYLNLSRDSKLRKLIEKKWVPWFFDRLLNSRPQDSHHIELFSTGITDTHRHQLLEDLSRLIDKYREIGASDQKIGQRKFIPVAMCIGIGPYRVGMFDG